jgi:hypothetical protein
MEKVGRDEQSTTRRPGTLSAAAQSGLGRLNEIAAVEDAAARILAVGEWKARAEELGVLEESTMINGTLMTLAKWADEIASGALLETGK